MASKGRKATGTTARAERAASFPLGLSSDWYWEQDASLRFVRVEARDESDRRLAAALIGKARWETGVEVEGGWDAHRALLEAKQPFRDVLMWRRLEDGSRRYLNVSGDPVLDAAGRFAGYRGIGRDITKQKRMQQLLRLQHAVTRRLAEAPGVEEAIAGALQAICEAEGWDCAEFWTHDGEKLRVLVDWARPGDPEADTFVNATRSFALEPGSGLVGTVWQSGEILWVPDAANDPRGLRRGVAERTGLRGAALLPVRYGGRVAGVLNFHSRRIRPPDKRLLQALNAIVAQIGQHLQRADAERAVRESEERFRSLTHLSSDWYWEQDAELRFTRVEGRGVADGELARRVLGQRCWDTPGQEVEGGWDAYRDIVGARRSFHDVLMWRPLPDGSMRYVSVSGEPVFAPGGRFAGYRGVGRDVTQQKRAEQMLQLEHRVARLLAAAEDPAAGVCAVIEAVCSAEGWACGRYFAAHEQDGVLRFQHGWATGEPEFQRFLAESRNLAYAFGDGLGGTVWKTGEPLWTADVHRDPRAHHATVPASRAIGIRGVFIFPVVSEGRTLGVLSFSSPRLREPDPRLLQASRLIGIQVGQFLHRKQAEASLRESEARFRSLTQMSSDFFWETDEAHRLTQLVHGPNYSSSIMNRGVIGKAIWDVPSLSPDEAGWAAQRAAMEQRRPFRDFEFARGMPDGVVRYFSISGEPRLEGGGFQGYRGVGRDITEIALARERIASLAYSDPLTGLANRTSLGPSLEQAVQRARRKNAKLAVVFLDLDGFKEINDVHGHDAGDALLIETAGRLRAHLRSSDFVARLGGDEFLVVLEEVADPAPVEKVARKLLSEVVRPYRLPSGEATVTASIGISVFPDDAADTFALMKHADTAMYAAKQAGKNTFRFYRAGPAANEPTSGTRESGGALSA